MNKTWRVWFAWYPVKTNDGWVWLKKVKWAYNHIGLWNMDYIYTKIKEN